MKKILRYKNRFTARAAVVLLSAFALAGCVRDDLDYGNPTGSNDALVEFSIRVPGNSLPSTRALNATKESEIVSVDVLAFSGDGDAATFLYHENTGTINGDKFTVKLKKSSTEVRFVFLANAEDIITTAYGTNKIEGTYTYKDIREALDKTSDQWNTGASYHKLPMWGEGKFAVTDAPLSDADQTISLVRMLAKIEIVSEVSDFVIEEVYLYHPMPKGYLIPDPVKWDGTNGEMKATAPTVDNSSKRNSGRHPYTLSVSETDFKYKIYTFETPKGDGTPNSGGDIDEGNTFLVVGGLYGTDTEKTYFRIDIAQKREQSSEYDYLPLLRNQSYNFTINKVEGAGYATPDKAAEALPLNIEVALEVQNDYELRYYAWDGQYMLATEDKELEYPAGGDDYEIIIKTDYKEWKAEASDSDTDPLVPVPGDWLTLKSPFTGSKGQSKLGFSLTQNFTGAERIAYIHIMAGRLSLVVTVNQEGNAEQDYILRVNSAGELNLDGDGDVVFFKWGSTIGISGIAEGDFNKDMIVWTPEGFDEDALKNAIGNKTKGDAYLMIPYADETIHNGAYAAAFPSENTPQQLTDGLGDPCKLATKNGQVGGHKNTIGCKR